MAAQAVDELPVLRDLVCTLAGAAVAWPTASVCGVMDLVTRHRLTLTLEQGNLTVQFESYSIEYESLSVELLELQRHASCGIAVWASLK
jgi:hypothetical protein